VQEDGIRRLLALATAQQAYFNASEMVAKDLTFVLRGCVARGSFFFFE
jgi:hypothetical protein